MANVRLTMSAHEGRSLRFQFRATPKDVRKIERLARKYETSRAGVLRMLITQEDRKHEQGKGKRKA